MKRLFASCALLLSINTVNAQTFTLGQLIGVRALVDLPSINTYLSERGWAFTESAPEEATDQVVWHHPQAGRKDAVLNVIFCNQGSNTFCDKPYIHADGDGAQHATTIVYQPTREVFFAIKKEAEANKSSLKTTLYSGALNLIYTGANFELTLSEITAQQSRTRYIIQLVQKGIPEDSGN